MATEYIILVELLSQIIKPVDKSLNFNLATDSNNKSKSKTYEGHIQIVGSTVNYFLRLRDFRLDLENLNTTEANFQFLENHMC